MRFGVVTSLALTLSVGGVTETVHVAGTDGTINLKFVTTESLVTRDQIEQTPGALRTNSMDIITQFVPGSYMVHDQLHIRGGHQVSWLIDGVPVPDTNIADTVGPQFDPKDIETIEVKGIGSISGGSRSQTLSRFPRRGLAVPSVRQDSCGLANCPSRVYSL